MVSSMDHKRANDHDTGLNLSLIHIFTEVITAIISIGVYRKAIARP